jgi:hypothetical protein
MASDGIDGRQPRSGQEMASHKTIKALCPKCRNDMIYVTAIPHPTAPQMQRTTFVCFPCNQTRAYMLSAAMADVYAAIAAPTAATA